MFDVSPELAQNRGKFCHGGLCSSRNAMSRDPQASGRTKIGQVYILSNPSMPGIVKIGTTTSGESEERAKALSKHSGVPLPFEVEHTELVEDPHQIERLIHARLEHARIAADREFFRLEIVDAILQVQKIIHRSNEYFEGIVSQLEEFIHLTDRYPDRFKDSEDNSVKKMKANLKEFLSGRYWESPERFEEWKARFENQKPK